MVASSSDSAFMRAYVAASWSTSSLSFASVKMRGARFAGPMRPILRRVRENTEGIGALIRRFAAQTSEPPALAIGYSSGHCISIIRDDGRARDGRRPRPCARRYATTSISTTCSMRRRFGRGVRCADARTEGDRGEASGAGDAGFADAAGWWQAEGGLCQGCAFAADALAGQREHAEELADWDRRVRALAGYAEIRM